MGAASRNRVKFVSFLIKMNSQGFTECVCLPYDGVWGLASAALVNIYPTPNSYRIAKRGEDRFSRMRFVVVYNANNKLWHTP